MGIKSETQRYRELAGKAAKFEREGDYDGAAFCWKRALAYSLSKTQAHWCDSRAKFCESIFARAK